MDRRCVITGASEVARRIPGVYRSMGTAELKEIIDRRTPEERKWMTPYLLDEMFSGPELRQTAEELSKLARRRDDLLTGRSRVAEEDAEAHWNNGDK